VNRRPSPALVFPDVVDHLALPPHRLHLLRLDSSLVAPLLPRPSACCPTRRPSASRCAALLPRADPSSSLSADERPLRLLPLSLLLALAAGAQPARPRPVVGARRRPRRVVPASAPAARPDGLVRGPEPVVPPARGDELGLGPLQHGRPPVAARPLLRGPGADQAGLSHRS